MVVVVMKNDVVVIFMPYPTLGSDRERLNLDMLPVPLLFIVILSVPDWIHGFRAWYLHLWL